MIGEQEIRDIAENVYRCVLGLEVERAADDAPVFPVQGVDDVAAGFSPDSPITGWVRLTGAWEGAVAITCSMKHAERAASAMYAMDPGRASNDQVRDALGEIAHMIGGNIKALLPSPTNLSLPSVVQGRRFAGASTVPALCSVTFIADQDAFVVSVFSAPN